MFRFSLASVLAAAEAGTLSVTWKDCGAKHATVTDLQPTSIHTGATETLTGTGTVDEDVTSAHFTATVSALGAKLTECSGDATTDIVCNLPMGVGKITVKAVSYPLAKGTVSIPVEVQTSSVIPPSLANVDVHIAATEQNGEDVICLDVHTAAQRQFAFEPTPAPPCDCAWAEAQGCENISDDGSKCYDYCCGGSPTPGPDPFDCTWAEEQGCENVSDDGSPAYKFCCAGKPTQPPKPPFDCTWAAAGCEYFDDDGSASYAYCCGTETTTPAVLSNHPKLEAPAPTTPQPAPAPVAPCDCTWAEEQGCENISDDGSLCYDFCCGGTPTPDPKPHYDCTWAALGCEYFDDDGSPAYEFCCGTSPAPAPTPTPATTVTPVSNPNVEPTTTAAPAPSPVAPCDCTWAEEQGCENISDDGSLCYDFCCGGTPTPDPKPHYDCTWAAAGCEHFDDDGSPAYQYCCGTETTTPAVPSNHPKLEAPAPTTPQPAPAPVAPCDCTWAEQQGCENIGDDGSVCYDFCCGGTPTPDPKPHYDCTWAAAGCEHFDDDGSAAYAFCCGASPAPAPVTPAPAPFPTYEGSCCWGGSSCDDAHSCANGFAHCASSEDLCAGECGGRWCENHAAFV